MKIVTSVLRGELNTYYSERLELGSQLQVAPAVLANNVAGDLLDALCRFFAVVAHALAAVIALLIPVALIAASFTNQIIT